MVWGLAEPFVKMRTLSLNHLLKLQVYWCHFQFLQYIWTKQLSIFHLLFVLFLRHLHSCVKATYQSSKYMDMDQCREGEVTAY